MKQLNLSLIKVIDGDKYLIVFGAINNASTCYNFIIVDKQTFFNFMKVSENFKEINLPNDFDPSEKYKFNNNVLDDHYDDIINWFKGKGMPIPPLAA